MSALRRLTTADQRRDIGGLPWVTIDDGRTVPPPGSRTSTVHALGVGAVFACVRLIAQSIGTVPLLAYRGDNRAERTDLWTLVHDRPWPGMTAGEMWQTVAAHMAGWGEAFVWKRRDRFGIVGLLALPPDCVRVDRRPDGTLTYTYRPPTGAKAVELPASEVLHFRYFTLDGLTGVSPIGMVARELAAIDAESTFRASLLRNEARLSGVLTTDSELSDRAAARVAKSWRERHQGASKAGSVAVLEGGLRWLPMSAAPKDLEFVQQRAASVADVARWFGVPPSLLNAPSNDSLTYSTTEAEAASFVRYCLMPYLRRIEQVISNDVDLAPGGLRVEFLLDSLLRADSLTRSQVYEIQHRIGVLTADEIRAAENRPPLKSPPSPPATPATEAQP